MTAAETPDAATFSGSAALASTVKVNGVAATYDPGTGAWQVTPAALTYGQQYTIVASQVDSANNTGTSSAVITRPPVSQFAWNVDLRGAGVSQVLVTHGYRDELTRWLREHGRDAEAVETRFEGETLEAPDASIEDTPPAPLSQA